jgi:hypothetical protein
MARMKGLKPDADYATWQEWLEFLLSRGSSRTAIFFFFIIHVIRVIRG